MNKNMRNPNKAETHDLFFAWELWAVVRRLEAVRYPNPIDSLRAVFGDAPPARLPSDRELAVYGVDLHVLDLELSQGMDPVLFTKALRLRLLHVESFNESPRNRENRSEFYSALATVVDRVESKNRRIAARKARLAAQLLRQFEQQERAAMSRSLAHIVNL